MMHPRLRAFAFLAFVAFFSLLPGGLVVACSASQLATVAHGVSCLEGCGPLVEEVLPATKARSLTADAAARELPALHRTCTQWTPVDGGADAR